MPTFFSFVWDQSDNVLFFTIPVSFWNTNWTCFHFFIIQNIKRNCWILFLRCFSVDYFWWVFHSIPVIFIYKCFNLIFKTLFRFHLIFSWFNPSAGVYWKYLWSLFSGFIVPCFSYNGETLCMISSVLSCDFRNKTVESNQK